MSPLGRPVRVAVVGYGYWGAKHVRVLASAPEVEVFVVDAHAGRLAEAAARYQSARFASDLDEVLDDIDAVVVATPPASHVGVARRALEAGKHVLVEKPLATTVADAELLVETAARQGVQLMVGHTFEYNAAVWKLRELVQQGELGRVYYMDSARLNLGLYQPDVNVVWDLAPHDVSIFNYVLGAVPESVQAWGSRHGHHLLEDVAYLRLLYRNPDVTANIHVSWLDPCKVRRTTVVGSSKMAVYNDLSADERIRVFDKGLVAPSDDGNLQDLPMSYRYGEIRAPYVTFEEPLSVQDREFVSCVLNGVQPATDGNNGLTVVRVLECAERSLPTGRPVRLDEVEDESRLAKVS